MGNHFLFGNYKETAIITVFTMCHLRVKALFEIQVPNATISFIIIYLQCASWLINVGHDLLSR